MSNLNEHVAGSKNLIKINEHGLRLDLKVNKNIMNSRDFTSACWVGIDVEKPDEACAYNGDFEGYIDRYCQEKLDCKIDDIIWLLVDHYSVGQTMVFAAGDNTKGWVERGVSGSFIYVKKEATIESHMNHPSFTMESIISNTLVGLKEQVEEYNAWCNGEVFSGAIKVDQCVSLSDTVRHITTAESAIVNIDKGGEYAVSEMLRDTVNSINAIKSQVVTFTVKVNDDVDLANSPTVQFYEQIQVKFNFKPAFGTIEVDHQERIIKITMLLATVPPFMVLCSHGRALTRQNIFKLMMSLVRRTGDDNNFDLIDEFDLIDILTESESYSEWSNHLLIALLTMIVNETKDFTFESMDWQDERAIGNNKEPVSYSDVVKEYLHNNKRDALIHENNVLLALDELMGTHKRFSPQERYVDPDILAMGYSGIDTIDNKLSLYNSNKESMQVVGAKLATKKGCASLADMLYQAMRDYNYSAETIGNALNAVLVSKEDYLEGSVTIIEWLVLEVVSHLYAELDALHASIQNRSSDQYPQHV